MSVSEAVGSFNATGQVLLAVTNATGNVALANNAATVLVYNAGPNVAYVTFGTSTVTATTSNIPVLVGQQAVLYIGSIQGAAYLAAITSSGTASLVITSGSDANVPFTIAYPFGKTVSITQTPAVTASNSYGANYVVGGLITFANALGPTGSGIVQSVAVTCKKVESSGFTLLLFNANPSNSTWTDASVSAINAADIASLRAAIPLVANSQAGTCTILNADALGIAMGPGITTLYGVLLANAALTNQFGSTSDITVSLKVLQDF